MVEPAVAASPRRASTTVSVLNQVKVKGVTPDQALRWRSSLVAWELSKAGRARPPVWLIYTDELRKDVRTLMNVKRLLSNYDIEEERLADLGKITKIYDQEQEAAELRESGAGNRNTDANKFLDEVMDYSIDNDVSDIHIERRRLDSRIRMRMLGHLQTYMEEVSTTFISQVCRAIYNVEAEEEGKAVSFREDMPQAASIARHIKGQEYKLRFQSLPAYPDGYDVVLRVLRVGAEGDMKYTTLEELGYSPDQIILIQEIVSKPIGVLIVAGVTGSGKSTTLKSLIMWINATRQYRCKIYSIEDPPEYRIPGITQMPVKQLEGGESGSPFHAPLKAAMRGDPDVIMIGEVRDGTTGDGIKKATQSGHQVLTTIHAPSSFGIFGRLRDFGLDLSTLGADDFISGLIYQRLVPTLCPTCRKSFLQEIQSSSVTDEMVSLGQRLVDVFQNDLGEDNEPGKGRRLSDEEILREVYLQGPGCNDCRGLGINGRTVCAEVVKPDSVMFSLIEQDRISDAKWAWRQKSDQKPHSTKMDGKTALEHALTKVATGRVSPVDVEILFGRVDTDKQKFKEMKQNAQYQAEQNYPSHGAPRRPTPVPARRAAAWED